LTSLSSWSISWTAPSSGIAPTFYSGGLWNEGTTSWLESNANITSPYTGVAAIAQDTNYHAIIYAERPEGLYSGKISTTLKLASPAAPTGVDVNAIVVGAANVATYTPVVTVGGSDSIYVGISTTSGGTKPTTLWSSGAVTSPIALAIGTVYYVTAMTSNTTTGTVSSYINKKVMLPSAPVFSTNTISNTTFTAAATNPSSTNGSTLSYTISPSKDTSQAVSGTFTSLTSDTQYTVTASASYGLLTTSTVGTAVWCLSPPTLSWYTYSIPPAVYVTIGAISSHATGVVISNVDNGSATATPLATSTTVAWFTRGATTTSNTFASNTLVKYTVNAVASNTSRTSSSLSFIVVDPGLGSNISITLGAATFSYIVCGGQGGRGQDTAGQFYAAYGYPGYGTGSSTLSVGATLLLCPGQIGYDGSYSAYYNAGCNYATPIANCGDGSKGGNGGAGAADTSIYNGNGGCGGGGGSASQILCVASNYMIVAPGGGGSGGGGGQGGNGGDGGTPAGGQGASYSSSLYDSTNGGGYYGGYGGSSGSGGASGYGLTPPGGYGQGTAGTSMANTISANGSTSGCGGSGARFFGSVAGGGGGGCGGGGGGAARNYSNSHDGGGGGGGGAYSSDGNATWQTLVSLPMMVVYWYS